MEGQSLPVDGSTFRSVLDQARAQVTIRPIVVAFRAEGAEITVVVGDASGTSLVYFPADSRAAPGSRTSVDSREAFDQDEWEPLLVADYFGHWSEFPRWSVVPHSLGEQAVAEFLDSPFEAPRSIAWLED